MAQLLCMIERPPSPLSLQRDEPFQRTKKRTMKQYELEDWGDSVRLECVQFSELL